MRSTTTTNMMILLLMMLMLVDLRHPSCFCSTWVVEASWPYCGMSSYLKSLIVKVQVATIDETCYLVVLIQLLLILLHEGCLLLHEPAFACHETDYTAM
eukprot:6092961-Amphidinium_carterae.1